MLCQFHSKRVLGTCATYNCQCIGERKCNIRSLETLQTGKCKMKIQSHKKTESACFPIDKCRSLSYVPPHLTVWTMSPPPLWTAITLVKLHIKLVQFARNWPDEKAITVWSLKRKSRILYFVASRTC